MKIDCQFPGGNILLEGFDGDTVRLRQDRRDTTEWWFYWHFRVRGAAGRTLRFEFTDGNVFAAAGPCHSRNGETWAWLGTTCVDGDAFTHTFAENEDTAFFAFCFPYTERHLRRFLAYHPAIAVTTLTRSEQGRPVELLRIVSPRPRGAVLLAARTHACETMASFALEGFLHFWLGRDPEAACLREHYEVFAVPFIDKDGVEAGDQGKLRAPYDHARDFRPSPRYASTAALMKLIDAHRERWIAGLDLHCPWIRSGCNETFFFIGTFPQWQPPMTDYVRVLAETYRAPIDFRAGDIFPVGVEWNKGTGETLAHYLREHTAVRLAATVEIAYAKVRERTITPDDARAFGADLARALARAQPGDHDNPSLP